MKRFETVDELACADLDELTAFIEETGRNFADPAGKATAIQTASRNSYRLPVTVNNSVTQAMAVSLAAMRALEKQIKVLDKTIEQQFEIIPNTLTSNPGIGKVYSAGIIAEIGDIDRFESQVSLTNRPCFKKLSEAGLWLVLPFICRTTLFPLFPSLNFSLNHPLTLYHWTYITVSMPNLYGIKPIFL